MMSIRNWHKGFTITELSLAMSGLSVLLILLITSAIAITAIYNKGLVLKGANQSGRSISEDMQRSMRQAQEVRVRYDAGVPVALCTGKVSYVWSARHKNPAQEKVYTYAPDDGVTRPIGLARVADNGGGLCAEGRALSGIIRFNNFAAGGFNAKEMLSENLAIRYATPNPEDLTIITGLGASLVRPIGADAQSTKLVRFQYTIGSVNGEDFIDNGSGEEVCKGGKDGEFCALNTFEVTAYSRFAR